MGEGVFETIWGRGDPVLRDCDLVTFDSQREAAEVGEADHREVQPQGQLKSLT